MNKVSFGSGPFMTPMPAVLVGANVGGRPNYMAVAWAGVACMDPPMIAVAIGKERHTGKGIVENRTFSVNIPSARDAAAVDHCGLVSGKRADKSAIFETFYGELGTAPLIGEFPVNIECALRHTLELGTHDLHVGEIINIHVAQGCMTEGVPDIRKIDPIVYSGNEYYRIGEVIGEAFSIGKGFRK
jgi:flavin reductase (DIM6/NTAB) family NADH-FMN oxidoreductase RutF